MKLEPKKIPFTAAAVVMAMTFVAGPLYLRQAQAAFAAAEFLMDYLKTRAPFWKLEERSGTSRWVETRKVDDKAVSRWRED